MSKVKCDNCYRMHASQETVDYCYWASAMMLLLANCKSNSTVQTEDPFVHTENPFGDPCEADEYW